MLRGILFDFNGVLLDDEPIHFELFRRVLGEEGFELTASAYYRDYVRFDDASGFRHALEKWRGDVDESSVARLCARKASYYQARVRDGYPFFAGAAELVREAAAAGLALGIVSGALRSEIEPALRQEGLESLIRVVVAAEDVDRPKPDPEGYLQGIQRLNREPPLPERLFHAHEVLAIEDTPAGLQAAAAAGMPTLGVGHTFGADNLAMADLTVTSIDRVRVAELHGQLTELSRR